MALVTAARLKRLCPSARADLIAAIVDNWEVAEAAEINTPRRIAHFLAQIATETGGLRSIEENLNYSAKRLRAVWPKRFPSDAVAAKYAGHPQALANYVYGGRNGNGPASSGDGWRFRGGGMIQTTGRANYAAAGYEDDPDEVREPEGAFKSAVDFWSDHGLNDTADGDNLRAVRLKVNGGTNGLDEARQYLARAKTLFTGGGAVGLLAEPEAVDEEPVEDAVDAVPEAADIAGQSSTLTELRGKLSELNDAIRPAELAKDSGIVSAGRKVVIGTLAGGATTGGSLVVKAAADDQQVGFWASLNNMANDVPGLVYCAIIFLLLATLAIYATFNIQRRLLMQKQGVVLPTAGRKLG